MNGTTRDTQENRCDAAIEREWSETTPPSTALVSAVADAREVDPIDLRPLYEVADADALDSMLVERRATDVTITVEYEGFRATLRGDGRIELVEINS